MGQANAVSLIQSLLGRLGVAVHRGPRVAAWDALRASAREALRGAGIEVRRLAPPPALPATRRIASAYYRGRRFQCFLDDYLGSCILLGQGWDNELAEVLDAVVGRAPSGSIIEVGANIGASLVPLASAYPGLEFHCVEPVPEFFELLTANASTFDDIGNVRLYNCALGASNNEELRLRVHVGTAGAVSEYDTHQLVRDVSVPTRCADDMFGHLRVLLMKVDVDGFEIDVLRGAERLLTSQRPILFLEFSTRIMRRRGVNPEAVTSLISRCGYDHVSIFENGRLTEQTRDIDRLIAASDAAPYYVDALIEYCGSQPPLLRNMEGSCGSS